MLLRKETCCKILNSMYSKGKNSELSNRLVRQRTSNEELMNKLVYVNAKVSECS